MTNVYRLTLTDATGAQTVRMVDQDSFDEAIDTYEALGSQYPVGQRERQMRGGSWKVDAGWDIRPSKLAAAPAAARHDHLADMVATAKLNDQEDRRQARRDYYNRTGR